VLYIVPSIALKQKSGILAITMEMKLQAQPREKTGTKAAKALRETGAIPAVVCGEVKETLHITLQTKEFEKVWREAGESTLIDLSGVGNTLSVLIQGVDVDPVYGQPIHADFYAVNANETIEVAVPLVFTGVAPAEKELGGTLIKVLYEIEVEALPKDLPHEIEVDTSALKTFDDQIRVEDIKLPKGVTARTAADEVVALVQEAKEEEIPTEAPDVASVEVEKKGKEEPEETA
jgi:large subunit ribosomal protein L25